MPSIFCRQAVLLLAACMCTGVEAFMPRASLLSTAKIHSESLASYGRGSIPLAWQKRARILQVPGIQMKSSQILDGVVLYNTLKRDKEPFVAKQNGKVSMYTCGPTVYDFAHIGNFRAFLTYDLLKRWLSYAGYDVDHVCNLTDVDDKIIQRMQRDSIKLKPLTDKFAQAFMDDLATLNILPAREYPRATDHIPEMVEMISGLVEKGSAYEKDGSYYFDVSSFPDYGKLARLNFDEMVDGAGEGGGITDASEFEKANSRDFALWKAYKEADGEVFWDTKLGKGRPGWHIECSAMSRRYLGDSFDIHAGGVDLTFPHHENEIAQSEAFCGCEYCNVWVHNGFVNINNEKMSKSLGNFLTVRDTLTTALDARAFRYLVISSQYRQGLNFTPESLQSSKNTVKRLDKWRAKLLEVAGGAAPATKGEVKELGDKCIAGFVEAMKDDMNTPRACAQLFMLIKGTEKGLNAGSMEASCAAAALATLADMDQVLGMCYDPPGFTAAEPAAAVAEAPADLVALLEERLTAKAKKNWARADEIRDTCAARGFSIKDVKDGPSVLVPLQ